MLKVTKLSMFAGSLAFASFTTAAVNIMVSAGGLRDSGGLSLSSGFLMLAVDSGDDGFTLPSATEFLPSIDDKELARWDFSEGGSVLVPGEFTDSVLVSPYVPAYEGKRLALFWFPSLDKTATAPGAGVQFGVYSDPSNASVEEAWVMPADGTGGAGYLLTMFAEGSILNVSPFVSQYVAEASLEEGVSLGAISDVTPTPTKASPSSNSIDWDLTSAAQGYTVQRRKVGDSDWTTIGAVSGTTNTFLDSTIKAGLVYEYQVVAENGLEAMSFASAEQLFSERSVFEFVTSRAQIVNGGHPATSKLVGRVRVSGNDANKKLMIQALGPHHRLQFGDRWVSNTRMELFWHEEGNFGNFRLDGDNTNWNTNINALDIDTVMTALNDHDPEGAKLILGDDPSANPPYVDKNSIILDDLEANIDYTFRTTSLDDSGNSWIGIFDTEFLDPLTERDNRIVNLQVRGYMGANNANFTDLDRFNGGVKIRGNVKKQVMLVAWGPSLTDAPDDSHNLPSGQELVDPLIRLFNFGNATPIAENDDWQVQSGDSAFVETDMAKVNAALAAKGYNLTDGSKDAVLLVTLDPGNYIFRVFGDGTPGVSVIDLDEIEL